MVSVKYVKYLILSLCFIAFTTDAEANTSRRYPKHQFGLGFSTISGGGLTYQLDIDKINTLRLNFFAYYQGEEPPDRVKLYANIGIEYQYNLYNNRKERAYVFTGMSYWLVEKRDYEWDYINDIKTKIADNELYRLFNTGLGLGYEVKFWGRAAFSVSLGVHFQISEESSLDKLFDRNPTGDSFIGIGGGIGLRYTF